MSRETAEAWFREQGVDPQTAIAGALAILERHGYSASSIDTLMHERLGDEAASEVDDEFDGALEVLTHAREAGYSLA